MPRTSDFHDWLPDEPGPYHPAMILQQLIRAGYSFQAVGFYGCAAHPSIPGMRVVNYRTSTARNGADAITDDQAVRINFQDDTFTIAETVPIAYVLRSIADMNNHNYFTVPISAGEVIVTSVPESDPYRSVYQLSYISVERIDGRLHMRLYSTAHYRSRFGTSMIGPTAPFVAASSPIDWGSYIGPGNPGWTQAEQMAREYFLRVGEDVVASGPPVLTVPVSSEVLGELALTPGGQLPMMAARAPHFRPPPVFYDEDGEDEEYDPDRD